ncbi:MAG TPA: hypothetical protein VN629_09910 [Castellaniella sp.]|nr:hypothetical protein [Castellaniella sp.]
MTINRVLAVPRRFETVGRFVGALLGLLAGLPTGAAPTWNLAEQIRDPAWIWSRPQEYDLSGVRVRLQHFEASIAPDHAARRLASLSPPRFVRLQVVGSSLWLSGMPIGEHWIAHLGGTSVRTTGLVSSLMPGNDKRGPQRFDARILVPCGSAPVLRMASRDPVAASIIRVECRGSERQILGQLRRRLRMAHWEPKDGVVSASGPLARDWRHSSGAELSVLAEVHPSRIVLTFWHRVSESRP